jgi:hypothetical protein
VWEALRECMPMTARIRITEDHRAPLSGLAVCARLPASSQPPPRAL